MRYYDKRVKSAETVIKIAVVLRLVIIAWTALKWAQAYADERENLERIYNNGGSFVAAIIPVFIADMILTVLWLYHTKVHTVHLILYSILGYFFYTGYFIDMYNVSSVWGMIGAMFIAPFLWAVGFVPFIIGGIGRGRLTKAIREKIEFERDI